MSEVQKKKEIVPYSCAPRKAIRTFTPIGDRYMIKAKLSVDDKGKQIAEPGDKVDLQAYIQASRASTDMATIVAKWKAGDESVINVNPHPFYGDVAIIPSNVNDVVKINQMSEKAYQSFESLPDELRALFGYSSETFFNELLTGNAEAKIRGYQEAKKQTTQAKPEPQASEGE